MSNKPLYHSYLVRLWQPDQASGAAKPLAWQGEITHVQSGSITAFEDIEQLCTYLLEQISEKDEHQS